MFAYPLTDPCQFDILRSRLVGARMQFDQLRRREFITLLGGAAAAWPLAAHAQPERMRRIGVPHTLAADAALAQARPRAILQGPAASGAMCKSRPAGRPAIPTVCANTRWNWSRSRRMSSWPVATRLRRRCCKPPALCFPSFL